MKVIVNGKTVPTALESKEAKTVTLQPGWIPVLCQPLMERKRKEEKYMKEFPDLHHYFNRRINGIFQILDEILK